jgi:hypothetical protein
VRGDPPGLIHCMMRCVAAGRSERKHQRHQERATIPFHIRWESNGNGDPRFTRSLCCVIP